MKTLPRTFTKGGMTYKQVMRQGDIAIYRQTKEEQSWEAFEVGIIQKNAARVIAGVQIEASESWPPSTEWGRIARTCKDLSRAKQRAFALIPKTP